MNNTNNTNNTKQTSSTHSCTPFRGLGGLSLFLFLFFIPCLYAQTDILIPRKNNNALVDIDTLQGIKNKTLRCDYDTLYIINRYGVNAFYKCIADLQRVKNLSTSLDSLTLNINSIQSNVNKMYYNISDVSNFIKKYNAETEKNLTTLTYDNKTLNENLLKVNTQLLDAQAKLKAQQRKNTGTMLMWGVGGVTVGGLLVGILMLAK